MPGDKARQQHRQPRHIEVFGNSQPQHPRRAGRRHDMLGLVRHGQQTACIHQHQLAVLGRHDVAARTVPQQKRLADGLLQLAHLLAYRGLRAMHAAGRPREAAFIRDAPQGSQEFQVQHDGSSSVYRQQLDRGLDIDLATDQILIINFTTL
ncbi:hypothetical protein G6F65_019508 [Rhizopus arrhizus]|nr:hypothetical protein G6F65_019508 [Rhizopus arrhizus]